MVPGSLLVLLLIGGFIHTMWLLVRQVDMLGVLEALVVGGLVFAFAWHLRGRYPFLAHTFSGLLWKVGLKLVFAMAFLVVMNLPLVVVLFDL